jgi:hypothetical protein
VRISIAFDNALERLIHRFDIPAAQASGFVNATVKFNQWVVEAGAHSMKAIDILSNHPLEATSVSERL